MSFVSDRFPPQIADVLTAALAHFVWQGTVLSLMLFFAVRLIRIRSVQIRYLMSVTTLVLMGLAPLLTIIWHQRSLAPIHAIGTTVSTSAVLAHTQADGKAVMAEVNQVFAFFHGPEIQRAIMFSWLGGVLIFTARLLFGYCFTLWIRTNAQPLSDQLEGISCRLGERMGVPIGKRVLISTRVGQAVAVGFFRPVVLLPVSWLTQLTPEVLEAVIAHELAHIRRWDLWVNLLQRLIETFLFYHPAVWWLSHRIRLEREMCCDEMAVNGLDRAVYVRSLESVAQIARGNLLLATSIHGDARMSLLIRIRHVLGMAQAETGSWGAAGFVAMIFPLMAIAAFSIAAGSAPNLALADEGKSSEVNEAEIKVGDRVVLRISGECAKECHRLLEVKTPFKPGQTPDIHTRIAEITPNGGCVIEVSDPLTKLVDDGKTPQLFTMTINFERSQLKKLPPWKDGDEYGMIGSKEGDEYIYAKGKIVMNDAKAPGAPEENVAVKFKFENNDTVLYSFAPKNRGMLLELSSLKGVKMNLWELKSKAGD